jgi:hypothetical protein
MSEKISSELDFSPVVSNHSTVLYRTVAPQGNNSAALSSTSTFGPVEFIIPPSVFRLNKSRLNFSVLAAASNAGFFNYINANTLTAISRITLYDSATNALWCDISNVNQYTSLVTPAATDFTEYSTKSFVSGTLQTAVVDAQKYTVEDISKCNIATVNDTGLNVDLAAENPYFSRRQFYIGGSQAATAIDVSIPFSAFKLSVLASDKLMYSPSNLVLQVYLNAFNNFAFQADVATDPTDGPAAVNGVTISNLSLSLANEGNLAIVSQIINKVMTSGISLPIAYPTVTRQVIAAATSHSYQLSLTRGYGNRILALITAPFHTTATLNTVNVHRRDTLSTYNTFLNNVAIKSQSGFDCVKSQDYIQANKEYLDYSVVQNLGEYIYGEWLHVDSFFGEKPLKDVDQHEVDGLDVGAQSSTWQIQANVTGGGTAFNWCTIIIGQKQLSVSNQGSMVQ